jgi:plastocyanin
MHRSRVLRTVLALSAVALLIAAGCGNDDNDNKASSSTTTTVKAPKDIEIGAGINDPKDANIAVLQFMPAKVTVAVGTPVNWEWNGTEPHSVTFLAPGQVLPEPGSDQSLFQPSPAKGPYSVDGTTMVNSGLQPLGPGTPTTFAASFTKPGSYQYHCVIHPQMVGEIDVVAAGGAVDSPAKVATARAADQAKWLAEGRAAKSKFDSAKPVSTKNKDGSSTWTVYMGTSTPHTDILAFSPMSSDIKAGDTIDFVNDSGAPHTASFFGKGAKQIQSPLDPAVDAPAPGPSPEVLTDTGFFNTGLVPPNAGSPAPPLGVRSFSFKVPTAGTYSYVCLLHASSEMTGSINASA